MRFSIGVIVIAAVGCQSSETPRTSATPSEVAEQNLTSKIDGLMKLVDGEPTRHELRVELVHSLVSRAHYFGRFEDFDTALEVGEEGVAIDPTNRATRTARAAALSAVHEFDRARIDLEAVGESTAIEDIVLAEKGRSESLLHAREAAAEAYPTFATLSGYAVVLSAEGRFDEADAAFASAEAVYRDVSPFPLAWIAFQRGVMWAERADQPEKAVPLYRRAVEMLPAYVSANVHLAELEYLSGDVETAIARLDTIAARTSDPEPLSRLSEYVGPESLSGMNYREKARVQYETLIARHPKAFLDHASEFYAGAGGDPVHALELARANLEFRQDERAYIIALRAAEAANATDDACSFAHEVADARTIVLQDLVRDTLATCP